MGRKTKEQKTSVLCIVPGRTVATELKIELCHYRETDFDAQQELKHFCKARGAKEGTCPMGLEKGGAPVSYSGHQRRRNADEFN